MIEVKLIKTEDLIEIRHKMLRQGKPRETCYFAGDELPSTFHIGAFVDGQLASIATCLDNNSSHFSALHQFQLRGMATLSDFAGQGVGTKVLEFAIAQVKQRKGHLIWCNARSSAAEFYLKFGFSTYGNEFDIPEVGPHFLMSKSI